MCWAMYLVWRIRATRGMHESSVSYLSIKIPHDPMRLYSTETKKKEQVKYFSLLSSFRQLAGLKTLSKATS